MVRPVLELNLFPFKKFNIWKEIYMKIPNSATEKIRNFFWQNSQVQWVLLWKLCNMANKDLEEEVAVYINVKQNGKRLVDGNQYTYSKVRERADKVYYACTQKKRIGCDATAVVQGDLIVKKFGQHNHDTNVVQKRVREEEDKAIAAAASNHTSPRSVLGDLTASVCNNSTGKIQLVTIVYIHCTYCIFISDRKGAGGGRQLI